jgi:AcrR family transcriptional regulator
LIKETEITEAVLQTASRMSGDERRMQILQIAIGLFSQKGFRGVTTKEIAASAGISEAMVFRHFATKHELYHAILDFKVCEGGMKNLPWEDEIEKKAVDENDDYKVFYNLAINALRHHKEDPDFMRLLFYSALDEHELSQIFFDEFVARIYEFFSSYISKRQKDGAMRDNVAPRVVVRAFVGMLIHHSLNSILWDKKRRLLDISDEQAAHEFTTILLEGVKK